MLLFHFQCFGKRYWHHIWNICSVIAISLTKDMVTELSTIFFISCLSGCCVFSQLSMFLKDTGILNGLSPPQKKNKLKISLSNVIIHILIEKHTNSICGKVGRNWLELVPSQALQRHVIEIGPFDAKACRRHIVVRHVPSACIYWYCQPDNSHRSEARIEHKFRKNFITLN